MKVFIDVGSHDGETLNEVLDKKYNFDKIYCIEPSKESISNLKQFRDNRIKIIPVAFGNENKKSKFFSSGDLSASIYSNNLNSKFEEIDIIKTSDWFDLEINEGDIVYVKLNCEGSECDIIDDLIDSNQILKIFSLLITYDVRDFKKLKYREVESRKKLRNTNLVNFCFADEMMKGKTHNLRIRNWLVSFGAYENLNLKELQKNYFNKQKYYSSKSGKFAMLENNFKDLILYKKYPKNIKRIFQLFKKLL